MNEDKKEEKSDRGRIEVEDFKEFASRRPPDPPSPEGRGLRGCGIALGIAALVFLFVVGTCLVAL